MQLKKKAFIIVSTALLILLLASCFSSDNNSNVGSARIAYYAFSANNAAYPLTDETLLLQMETLLSPDTWLDVDGRSLEDGEPTVDIFCSTLSPGFYSITTDGLISFEAGTYNGDEAFLQRQRSTTFTKQLALGEDSYVELVNILIENDHLLSVIDDPAAFVSEFFAGDNFTIMVGEHMLKSNDLTGNLTSAFQELSDAIVFYAQQDAFREAESEFYSSSFFIQIDNGDNQGITLMPNEHTAFLLKVTVPQRFDISEEAAQELSVYVQAVLDLLT